jgi:hypothetical protein
MGREASEIIRELEAKRSELSIAKAALDKLRRTGDTAAYEIDQRQQYIRGLEACIRQLKKELKALGIQEPEVKDTSVPWPVPPVTGTTHPLPFDSLSPRDFERLCLWLAKREGFKRAEHFGAAGSEQGRDIIAWRKGELWAFQCKRVQRFGPKDALAEVEKVLALLEAERPVGLVFVVTCDVRAKTRQQVRERCAEGNIECSFWVGTELDERVKRHSDIVKEFFQVS